MTPANDYAYRQVVGSLPRRGAEMEISPDGLTVTGTFQHPDAAEIAMAALGDKYPKRHVTVTQDGNTITFQFVPSERATEGGSIKLTTNQLRRIIRESVARRIELLEEAGELELDQPEQIDMTEYSEFIVEALAEWLSEDGHDLISS